MYDTVIIGCGPAGLSCGIYTSRFGLKTLIIEFFKIPSQAVLTDIIENYPGFPEGINGFDLVNRMKQQAEKFGCEFRSITELTKINLKKENGINFFEVVLLSGDEIENIETKTVVIATGRRHKHLQVEDEERFVGKGISYCGVCDAPLYKGKQVVVIGGGDSALQESLYISKFVSKLYLIHRRKEFRANKYLQDKIKNEPKIEKVVPYIVEKIVGENKVKSLIVKNVDTQEKKEIFCDGIFIFVGETPNTELFKGLVDMDENGYIITNDKMQTSVEGIFAIGDCRKSYLKQIVTAVSDGAIEAEFVKQYLEERWLKK